MDDFSSDAVRSALGMGSSVPSSQPTPSSVPAPMRNNNPGALMPGGKLAQYGSPEEGLAALDGNLKSYGDKGINTLSGVISRWAPPNENNTAAYIADASKATGLDPGAQIDLSNPYIRHQISAAIVRHENGPQAIYGSPTTQDPFADFSSASVNDAINGGTSGETPFRMEIRGTSTSGDAKPDLSQIPGRIIAPDANADPSILDRARGGIEAGLSAATGMVAAPIGAIAGVGYGLTHGYGTAEGAQNASKFAGDVTGNLTYQPRSAVGQEYAGNVGNVMGQLAPLGGLTAEMGALGHLAGPALNDARAATAAGPGELPVNLRVDPMMDKPRYKLTPEGPAPANAETQLRQQFQAAQAAPTGSNGRVEPSLTSTALPPASTPNGRLQEAASLPVPVQLTAGQSTGDIHAISWEQNNRSKFQDLGNRLNAQNGQLVQNLDAVRKQVAPDISAVGNDLNQQVVNAYKNMDAPVKADISAKYQALKDANGGQFPLSGKDFVNSADAALKADNVSRFVPPEIRGMLDDLRDGGPMNFNDFENYRTILAQQSRAQGANSTATHAINVVRNSLESLPMSDETATLKPLADAARQAAAARFANIRNDPAYKAAINDGVQVGEPSPVADNFIKKYIVNGKTSNVQNALSNLSNDPFNRQMLSAGVVDHLKDAGGLDLRTNAGNLRQSGLNGAIETLDKKSGLVLGPDAAGVVNKIGNVARYTQEQPIGSAVNNSNTLVGALGNAGAAGLEGAANFAAHGLPVGTLIRKGMQMRSANNRVNQALNPTGSTKLNSFP